MNAWNFTKGNGVKIGILDTGVSSHSDLNIAGGVSVIGSNFTDNNGHGTAVAGIVSSVLNDYGNAGVAPSASVYAVKIMNNSVGSLSDAISGVEWAIDNNMSIVLMSFGMETYSQIFKEVLDDAYNRNMLLIAASGNNGQDNILYPARYSSVVAVGAVDSSGNLASFSSYGFEQELVADGVNINTTWLNNGYSLFSGTSLAAPHVAGVAALIKSHNNSLTNNQIRGKMQNDASDLGSSGKDDYYGFGLVQANLYTTNYTLMNLSYFYEIFNISNYGVSNITYKFWLNGAGTIDDVRFEEGYYLVNFTFDGIKKSKIYNVSENGTLIILGITSIGFTDNYLGEGSSTNDAVVWEDGVLTYNISNPNSERDAECFDDDGNDNPERCYHKAGKLTQCNTFSSEGVGGSDKAKFYERCLNSSSCAVGVPHNEPLTTDSRGQGQVEITDYTDCDNSVEQQDFDDSNDPFYYIIDAKRAICDTGASYHYEGRYSSTQWINYKSASCSTTCDTSLDNQIITSSSGTVPNPCTSPVSTCNGGLNVGVSNNKETNFAGYYVYVNGVLNGTTNTGGTKQVDLGVECGVSQTINVTCKTNQSKVCESKTASIDFNGDNDSLVFNCNICNNNKNLEISLADIDYKQVSGNNYQFNITINNENVAGSFNVTIKGQDKSTGLVTKEASSIETITSSSITQYNSLISIDTSNVDYFHVYVDVKDNIKEVTETDNYVIVPFVKIKEKAYLDINTGNSKADEAIRGYLKLFVQRVEESNSNIIISISRNSSKVNSLNDYTKRNFGWYVDKSSSTPIVNRKTPIDLGLVGSFIYNNKVYIFAYGKYIEGDVAAVKN